MFRDQRFGFTGSIDRFLEGGGVVIVCLGSVCRWEEGFRESVFGNEVLRHYEEELSPYFSNSVDTPVSRLVESMVSGWVDGGVGGVGEVSDTPDVVGCPRSHRVDIRTVPACQ